MKINLSAASCPVILYCLFVLLSCERENPVEKQEERIESYIRTKMSKNPGLKLSQDDRVFYLYEPGDTATGVAAGDSVYFYYAGTLVTDTLRYFDTNVRELAEALGLNTESKNFEPLGVVAGNNDLLEGLGRGLLMSHPGDNGEIIFNSDMGFGDRAIGIVPPYSALIFKIFITRIRKN